MIMRKLMLLTVLAASLMAASCNTIAGAGKDVSATGHAVTDTAKDATPH
jgi:predicted small secreted protein